MSLQYLLDGYNITNQLSQLACEDPQTQRRYLISLIESRRPQGSSRNNVTLVFDGYPPSYNPNETHTVKVIFSMQISADERIRAMVEDSNNKINIIVVTDDRSIQYAVRAMGAKAMAVKEFLGKMDGPKSSSSQSGRSGSGVSPQKKISEGAQAKINKELADIWLNKKPKSS